MRDSPNPPHLSAVVPVFNESESLPQFLPELIEALARTGLPYEVLLVDDASTDIGCSLRAYRREVIADLPAFRGMHRFLPALCRMRGARVIEIPVGHRPRRAGRSKYGIGDRLVAGIWDLLGVRWLRSRL